MKEKKPYCQVNVKDTVGEDACKETSEQRPLSKIKNSNFNNKKTKNPIKTWDRDLKTHFFKDTQMTKKNAGRFVTREFQIETMRHHYINLLEWPKSRILTTPSIWKEVCKRKSHLAL